MLQEKKRKASQSIWLDWLAKNNNRLTRYCIWNNCLKIDAFSGLWINSVKFNKTDHASILVHNENFQMLGKTACDAKLIFCDVKELIKEIESVLKKLETEQNEKGA